MPIFRRKSSEKISEPSAADGASHTDHTISGAGLLRRLSSGSQKDHRHKTEQPKHDAATQASSPSTGLPSAATIASLSKAMGMTGQDSTAHTGPSASPHRHSSQTSDKKVPSRESSRSRHDAGASPHPSSAPGGGNLTMGEATQQPIDPDTLSRDDVRTLFHGAPHFMLEKGRRGRYFPQAFFPFASPLEITDLEDRQYLRHESFALATLHSHLPIPTEVDQARPGAPPPTVPTEPLPSASNTLAAPPSSSPGHSHSHSPSPSPSSSPSQSATEAPTPVSPSPSTPVTRTTHPLSPLTKTPSLERTGRLETNRRPMFDLGIYERPNLLSMTGRERGTFGMRAFLERPVADGLGDEKGEHVREHEHGHVSDSKKSDDTRGLSEHMSASEALKALAHDEGSVKVGKHAAWVERGALLRDGPKAWKRVGVREVSVRTVTERLELISKLRDEVLEKGWRYTVLDVWGERELGDWLFGELLFPPDKVGGGSESGSGVGMGGKGHELKVQIEALVKVLTTPGAWLDFSLPRERLWFCQGLYTREVKEQDKGDGAVRPEMKRRWALVQLLLAVELVIRLDAALRLGVALHSGEVEVSSVEIHHFNKLRNLKVDWDFVVARRWLDLCYVKRVPKKTLEGPDHALVSPSPAGHAPQSPKESHHGHRSGLLGRFKSSLHIQEKEPDADWPYECGVLPRQPGVMADGLVRFAEDIGWDASAVAAIETELARKLCDKPQRQREEMLALGTEALVHPHVAQHYRDSRSKVELRAAGQETLGGPLTHTWLGGLIIPGYLACDLLMCALLETDTAQRAVERLGNMAFPRTGFVLGGRSWWSKLCVVGMVLAGAEGAKERMGWVGLPDFLTPHDHETGEILGDGWRVVVAKDAPKLRQGERILDGDELAKESSPLGVGKGHVLASEFGMLTDQAFDGMEKTQVSDLRLVLRQQGTEGDPEYQAAVKANVKREGASDEHRTAQLLPLRYNVRFVGGHPCRPPHGHAKQQDDSQQQQQHQPLKHKQLEHLPAHPLHKSFKYTKRSIEEVLDLDPGDELTLPNPCDREGSPVWVIDARGGREREVLVRAWCATVGRHAIISRVGKGCLGCAVREARALEIGVVVRVEA